MTAVRLVKGARYGLRLYAIVLGTTILGGAAVGLGAAFGASEVRLLLDGGSPDLVPTAAAGLLAFIGVSILAVGYLGAAYKLVADAVATGGLAPPTEAGPTPAAATEAAAGPDPPPAAPTDGGTAEDAPATAVGPAARADARDSGGARKDASVAASDSGGGQPAEPPEPSPEEIAFGSSSEDGTDPEPVDQPASSAGGDSLPGQDAASDPLADPTDEE